ncbi:MAG TPA: hypothetical protein VFM85_03020 [Actinomycetota bacterium]|nr:hypothetical protein [Actinomycetota bacterium]
MAHGDGTVPQLTAAFDSVACAVALRYELESSEKASFGGNWNGPLAAAADEKLGPLILSIAAENEFKGLAFYRNLAAHRGVIAERQRGGPQGVRIVLPDWLPEESPDLPNSSLRPVLERYVVWARPKLTMLREAAVSAWGLVGDNRLLTW